MNLALIHAARARLQTAPNATHHPRHRRLSRLEPASVSRRTFVRTAAGAVTVGMALGGLVPNLVQAQAPEDPKPIPGGTPALGGAFHVYAPGPAEFGFDGVDAEPSSITDFNGFVGVAFISGTCRRTNTVTGEVVELPYLFNDMRFMQGVYRGFDGRSRRGTFGFI